jgi:hypothetical protein
VCTDLFSQLRPKKGKVKVGFVDLGSIISCLGSCLAALYPTPRAPGVTSDLHFSLLAFRFSLHVLSGHATRDTRHATARSTSLSQGHKQVPGRCLDVSFILFCKLSSKPNIMPAPVSAFERTFDRLPRPQRVLDLGRPLVPTATALVRTRHSLPPIAHDSLNDAQITIPPRTSLSPPSPPLITSFESPTHVGFEFESIEHSAVHALGPMVTLGKFTQDKTEWAVRAQRGRNKLIMVKRLDQAIDHVEMGLLESIVHRNIAKLVHSYIDAGSPCIALEYCRITLAEILHVHLRLEEPQLQLIARSVSCTLQTLCRLLSC